MFKSLGFVVVAVAFCYLKAKADQESFARMALAKDGAIVGECPTTGLTKNEVLESGVEKVIYKVTTQTKINISFGRLR